MAIDNSQVAISDFHHNGEEITTMDYNNNLDTEQILMSSIGDDPGTDILQKTRNAPFKHFRCYRFNSGM